MAKRKLNEEEVQTKEFQAEVARRRCMLMAAAEGITQSGLTDKLLAHYWEQNYQNGPLAEVLQQQLNGG